MHASLTRTRTCKHADQSTKAYPCPRSCWHDAAGTHTLATVSPAPFPSWPHLPVAGDHAQHSATPTPCRTRRITADRRASCCRPPARRSVPAAQLQHRQRQRPGWPLPASSPAPSSTAPRLAALARPLLQPRPIKGGAELSIPATQQSPPLASHLALALLLPPHCPRSRALPCEGETP